MRYNKTISNVINFPPLEPGKRPEDAPENLSGIDATITLIPTNEAYDSVLAYFKDQIGTLEDTPDPEAHRSLGRLAACIALLSTHPTYSWEYPATRICATLSRSSEYIQQQIGDFPSIMQLLGHLANSKHPPMRNLRGKALALISQSPGEFDLTTGQRHE